LTQPIGATLFPVVYGDFVCVKKMLKTEKLQQKSNNELTKAAALIASLLGWWILLICHKDNVTA
jgi:hypothetical protein